MIIFTINFHSQNKVAWGKFEGTLPTSEFNWEAITGPCSI